MLGKDLMILFTVDPRTNPERTALALSIAAAAQVSGAQVSFFLAQDGVFAAVKGGLKGLTVPEFAPLDEIMDILHEEGVKFHVCHPFLGPRNLRIEDLHEGVLLTSAVGLVQQGTNASILTF